MKSHNSCRHDVGNGRELGIKKKKCRQERISSVAADSNHLDNSNKEERKAQATQGLSKNCTSRERASSYIVSDQRFL